MPDTPMPAKPKTTAKPAAAAARPIAPPSLAERRAKVGIATAFVEAGIGLHVGAAPKPPTEGNEWKAIGATPGAFDDIPAEVSSRFNAALISASDYLTDYFEERP